MARLEAAALAPHVELITQVTENETDKKVQMAASKALEKLKSQG